jgi:hypothetical protein
MNFEQPLWIEYMLNVNRDSEHPESDDAAVDRIVQTSARGALALVAISTAIVIGIWLAFYLFVFLPRGPAP